MMSSTMTPGRPWPPSPSVEDESESLSRELPDPSVLNLAQDDSIMTVSNGTVDQVPIIIPADTIFTPCSTPPTDSCPSLTPPSGGSKSSVEHLGLATPPLPPVIVNNAHQPGSPKPNPSTGADMQGNQQPPKPTLNRHFSQGDEQHHIPEMAGKRHDWHSDDEARSYHGENSEYASHTGPVKKKKKVNFQLPDEPPTKRSAEEDDDFIPERQLAVLPDDSRDAYIVRNLSSSYHDDDTSTEDYDPAYVKYRPDYGYLVHPQPLRLNCNYDGPRRSSSDSGSPVTSPLKLTSRSSTHSPQRKNNSPTGYRHSDVSRSALDITKMILPRSRKDSRASSNTSPVRRKGSSSSPPLSSSGLEMMPYVTRGGDKQSRRVSIPPAAPCHLLSRSRSSTVPTQVIVRRQHSVPAPATLPCPPSTFSLAPCPRSIPMAGHQDWYTISGLSHLNICPSCMGQIGDSRFRDLFVPSLTKPRDTTVRCSLSEPWARLAWVQTMELRLSHLDLLYRITRPPPGIRTCPGPDLVAQSWYRLVDPETGRPLADFNACPACFHNLQALMPSLRGIFRRGQLAQERTCDLHTDSPRFVKYLDLLDTAAKGYSASRGVFDLHDFVEYARRKSTIPDCQRDHRANGPWHYIPELPEFIVCEDCYDDVVWESRKTGIGMMVSRDPHRVPGRRGQPHTCQLWSPRMRMVFREAVRDRNFKYLADAVLRRREAENLFWDRKMRLLDELERGYDRDAELRWNADDWRKIQ
ncbi:hypothetical protein FQN51_003683 [Onygenales sp. PD_10]|nr:hypothetical protein FQN51_003683 [Onygenales sp. PD_10]